MELKGVTESILKLSGLHILPCSLDDGDSAFVESISISLSELNEHLTCDELSSKLLWLDLLENLFSEVVHLLNEFTPQAIILNLIQILKLAFLLYRPN